MLLAHLQPLGCGQGQNFLFDLIDPGELRQGTLGDLALVGRVQLKELASRVCQAPGFCDALSKAGFVPGVVVADQTAAPLAQKGADVLAGAGLAEVAYSGERDR